MTKKVKGLPNWFEPTGDEELDVFLAHAMSVATLHFEADKSGVTRQRNQFQKNAEAFAARRKGAHDEERKLKQRIDRAYKERNALAVAFMRLAVTSGLEAGIAYDDSELTDDFAIVMVNLPDGKQVSWHLSDTTRDALNDCVRSAPAFPGTWDKTFLACDSLGENWVPSVPMTPPVKPMAVAAASSRDEEYSVLKYLFLTLREEHGTDLARDTLRRIGVHKLGDLKDSNEDEMNKALAIVAHALYEKASGKLLPLGPSREDVAPSPEREDCTRLPVTGHRDIDNLIYGAQALARNASELDDDCARRDIYNLAMDCAKKMHFFDELKSITPVPPKAVTVDQGWVIIDKVQEFSHGEIGTKHTPRTDVKASVYRVNADAAEVLRDAVSRDLETTQIANELWAHIKAQGENTSIRYFAQLIADTRELFHLRMKADMHEHGKSPSATLDPNNLPNIYAQFRTQGETGVVGTCSAKIHSTSLADDGSIVVNIDHWPDDDTPHPWDKSVRFCPECGHVGEVTAPALACCPEHHSSRMVPKSIAEKMHKIFKDSISNCLSPGEQSHVLRDPVCIASLMDYHDQKYSESEAVGLGDVHGDNWPTARWTELKKIAHDIIAEDPDLHHSEIQMRFGFAPRPKTDSEEPLFVVKFGTCELRGPREDVTMLSQFLPDVDDPDGGTLDDTQFDIAKQLLWRVVAHPKNGSTEEARRVVMNACGEVNPLVALRVKFGMAGMARIAAHAVDVLDPWYAEEKKNRK